MAFADAAVVSDDVGREKKKRYRTTSLLAAALSFGFHVLLGIFCNYVPLDHVGAGLVFWLYCWATVVLTYFGIIGVVAERYALIRTFACFLLVDSAILSACRFAILEYLTRRFQRETCIDTSKLRLGELRVGDGNPDTRDRLVNVPESGSAARGWLDAIDSRNCRLTLVWSHAICAVVLIAVMAAEIRLAVSVYKHGILVRRHAGKESEGETKICAE